uniref:Uncharacterized protein n=1 Tax=Gallus gallus TaxID=9031 RepID=A0A8V0XCU0_CHICK
MGCLWVWDPHNRILWVRNGILWVWDPHYGILCVRNGILWVWAPHDRALWGFSGSWPPHLIPVPHIRAPHLCPTEEPDLRELRVFDLHLDPDLPDGERPISVGQPHKRPYRPYGASKLREPRNGALSL